MENFQIKIFNTFQVYDSFAKKFLNPQSTYLKPQYLKIKNIKKILIQKMIY